jgi:multidrug efflux pump subunit AcrA (membrane-fusion protein)
MALRLWRITMKKRMLLVALFFILLAGYFLAGSWRQSKREALGNNSYGMESSAVKSTEESDTDNDNSPLLPGAIRISQERQQFIGVKTATVEKVSETHTLRALGRVVPDENRIYRINSATDGWIKKILPPTTDSLVEKDELLATFYTPEFFSALKA